MVMFNSAINKKDNKQTIDNDDEWITLREYHTKYNNYDKLFNPMDYYYSNNRNIWFKKMLSEGITKIDNNEPYINIKKYTEKYVRKQ